MRDITIQKALHAQAPTRKGSFRTTIEDGSATVLVADRRADMDQADVRVRAPKAITTYRAANAIAHRAGWTRDEVLAFYGIEGDARALKAEIARGPIRERYLSIIG